MTRANPFALSVCGHYVVERLEGERFPTVMQVDEALARQQRNEIAAAAYEADYDRMHVEGRLFDAGIARSCAAVALTIAAEIAEALNGGSNLRRAA